MLKADRNTQFGLGPLVLVNTNSKIPAFPVFMYRHRINGQWLINLYGGMFGVDYTPTKDDLIAVGADVDVKSFYFRPGVSGLPDRCRYSRASFRPMVKYRRRLIPNFYFEMLGGVSVKMSSKVSGITGTTEYMEVKEKTSPFLQTNISYAL